MKTIRLEDVPKTPVAMDGVANTVKQLPLGSADGSPTHAVRVFTLGPGGHTPFHAHAWEHLNYVISGEGELLDADGNARPLRTGDFALVLPDERHQYRNASDSEDFVMICAVPKAYE